MNPMPEDMLLCIPKNPVLGWSAFESETSADAPCILDLPGVTLTTSGRSSIALALKSLGVGQGDRVLAPSYHCPSMVSPIVAAGANPAFFPITRTGAADLSALDAIAGGIRPKAIIAAHYFGLPQPMAGLRRWCDERGVALIEDCAHCLFGISDGKPVGSWGHLSIASLTKFLPLPEGGAIRTGAAIRLAAPQHPRGVVANIRLLADMLELGARYRRLGLLNVPLSATFRVKNWLLHSKRTHSDQAAPVDAQDGPPAEYLSLDTGKVDLKMTRIGAWLARGLPRARMVALRRRNYLRLASNFARNNGRLRPLFPELPGQAAPYVFPLWVDEPEDAYRALKGMGLPLFRWDWLWPETPAIAGDSGLQWSRHVFQIGCHQSLTDADVDTITATLVRHIN